MAIKYINIFQSEALRIFPKLPKIFGLKTNHLAILRHSTCNKRLTTQTILVKLFRDKRVTFLKNDTKSAFYIHTHVKIIRRSNATFNHSDGIRTHDLQPVNNVLLIRKFFP
jgi:hypothetical protein